MKQALIFLGVFCPPLFVVLLIINIKRYKYAKEQTDYIDCFEMDDRIYRFNQRLLKKDYEKLRNNFVGSRTYRQCEEYHALQDYDVDVETLVATKSKYYSEYHRVY